MLKMTMQHLDRAEIIQKTKRIADQFNTILFGADPSKTKFYAAKGHGLDRLAATIEDRDSPDRLLVDNAGDWELSNERVKVLGKLYLSLDQLSRNTLVSMAEHGFRKDSPNAKYSAYLFTFIAKYHDLNTAIRCVLNSLVFSDISLNALYAVSNLLKYEPALPSDAQIEQVSLDFLRKWETLQSPELEQRPKVAHSPTAAQVQYDRLRLTIMRIARQAQEIKYQRLRDRLFSEANLEINQDRQTLLTGLAKFGFPRELIESLDHAEAEYRKADSNFDFKTSSDHNRSFLEKLLWETATKVATIRNEVLAAQQKSPVQVREYLHKAGFFSDRFHKLCEAFYHFTSEQSTHQLASGQEVARVVRNLNIEIGLLILRRLESFK